MDHIINLPESDKKFKLNDKTIIREMKTKRRERKWNGMTVRRRCKKAVTAASLNAKGHIRCNYTPSVLSRYSLTFSMCVFLFTVNYFFFFPRSQMLLAF